MNMIHLTIADKKYWNRMSEVIALIEACGSAASWSADRPQRRFRRGVAWRLPMSLLLFL